MKRDARGFCLYVLDNRVPVRVSDVLVWAQWFERTDERRVALTPLPDGTEVSTVFIGADPVMFETAHLRGDGATVMARTRTWGEAECAHLDVVAQLHRTDE